jgi:hypothetical protein
VITARGGSCEENADMPLVVVDDIEMYYESRGSGPALVVIGGLGLEMSELDTLLSRGIALSSSSQVRDGGRKPVSLRGRVSPARG